MAITMHDAVRIAKTQAQQLFEGQDTAHLMLEEVDFDEVKQVWLITLGYDSPHDVTITKLSEAPTISCVEEPCEFTGDKTIEKKTPRVYKVFQIDASDGRLLAMKMRDV